MSSLHPFRTFFFLLFFFLVCFRTTPIGVQELLRCSFPGSDQENIWNVRDCWPCLRQMPSPSCTISDSPKPFPFPQIPSCSFCLFVSLFLPGLCVDGYSLAPSSSSLPSRSQLLGHFNTSWCEGLSVSLVCYHGELILIIILIIFPMHL